MRKKSGLEDRLTTMIGPVLTDLGFELVDLELKREAGRRVLRLFVDSEDGINLDDCAEASTAVERVLDENDPIDGAYNIEVSSPGIERPLTKKEHYMRFSGERVRVKTFEPIEGRRDFTGVLGSVDETGFELLVEGRSRRIAFNQVAKANLKPGIDF